MSGAEIASEVAAAISEAGAEVGDGTPLTGSIIRVTGADESTYPPTPGTPTSYACTLILTDYSARDRDGTNITDRDLKAMISPDAETEPRNGDSLQVQGRTYSIENVTPYQPGGVVLYYIAQVRAGE
jgi:hypothetical protein